jgi:hypothetical protein
MEDEDLHEREHPCSVLKKACRGPAFQGKTKKNLMGCEECIYIWMQ